MSISETGDSYQHRQMRCKGGASIFFKGRRYRPGEYIDCDLPAEYADKIEPAPEATPTAPEPERPKYANPKKKVEPTEPLPDGEVADPFGNFKKRR